MLIHDLETIRASLRKDVSTKTRKRLNLEENSILKECNYIIAHNNKMMDYLNRVLGIEKNKLISLEIFDYLIPGFDEKFDSKKIRKENPIIIAGTLRLHKAKYVYDLPENVNFNLYGVGYEGREKDNIKYFGSFMPDALPFAMEGSFGLVWDGESADTCSGVYKPNFQGNAAVNYTDCETPWTRIIEHKWFEFGKDENGNEQPKTIISREYSSEWKPGDEPYYPVNDAKNGTLYTEYKKMADVEPKVIFGGRLGEYKYYDMDQVIAAALDRCEKEF